MKKESELSIENYILNLIEKRKSDLAELEEKRIEFSEKDYLILWNRYTASIADLYMVLTSYKNTLSTINKK